MYVSLCELITLSYPDVTLIFAPEIHEKDKLHFRNAKVFAVFCGHKFAYRIGILLH